MEFRAGSHPKMQDTALPGPLDEPLEACTRREEVRAAQFRAERHKWWAAPALTFPGRPRVCDPPVTCPVVVWKIFLLLYLS